jgi:peroxiredoxin
VLHGQNGVVGRVACAGPSAGPGLWSETMFNPLELPADLPAPEQDGAAEHLPGRAVPHVALPGTRGGMVDVAAVGCPRAILYFYPRTGRPGVDPPDGWDLIPGARGCTPQACAFRDHHRELLDLGAEVYGISSQGTADQAEGAERLHLPFPLLSDADLRLRHLLDLPTFRVEGEELYRRLTLVVRERAVEHVFYPVFPPDRHAGEVVAWLRAHPA